MITSSLSLHKSLLKDFEAQTVTLDIHLCSCKTVFCTSCLEVHITKVVFITKDITQNSIFIFAWVLNQSHCNTTYWLLHWNTSIHKCKSSCTNTSHRRRTVRFKNLTYKTNCIRIILRYLTLQSTPCQVTVTNLSTAYAALSFSLTC